MEKKKVLSQNLFSGKNFFFFGKKKAISSKVLILNRRIALNEILSDKVFLKNSKDVGARM